MLLTYEPLSRELLFIHTFRKGKMMNRGNKDGLKGQYTLAQGKRSIALGSGTDERIVRAITFFKDISFFRTKRREPQCQP